MNRAYSVISSRPCRALAGAALLLGAALPLAAQLTPQQDPANLAGERVSPPDLADTLSLNHGAPALEQLLRKLRTRASFMLIVAHPDDEDNGMLTYLSRGKGARVATLTLNRGEGGQNLMSGDFDDALGLIRTQELLAADRYMAVDQFFGTEVDFGFSKTKEEAFSKWTHDRVLYDTVRAIRLYRPLVIASVFIGEPSDGHGQHQVSGQIAQEAFNAAGDPSVFPDQIAAGLQPWQPLKVYARSPFGRIDAQGMYDSATSQYVPARFHNYVTGKVTDTVPKANVTIPEGDTDPLLGGESYAQLGREGRSLHRSQMGGGSGGPAGRGGGGRFDVSYHRYGSHVLGPDGKPQPDGDDSGLESGFYDGIDTSLPGIATLAPEVADKFRPLLEKIDQQIAEAQRLFDPAKPELTAPPLRIALKALDDFLHELEDANVNDLPPTETYNLLHELHIKRVQLNNALILALGITLEAHLGRGPGSSLIAGWPQVEVTETIAPVATGATKVPFKLTASGVSATGGATNSLTNRMETEKGVEQRFRVSLSNTAATRPYFSRTNIEQPFYNISDSNLRNAPATPAPLTAWTTFDDQGVQLRIEATVRTSEQSNPMQPAVFVPPVSVSVAPSVGIIPLSEQSLVITAQIQSLARDNDNSKPVINSSLPPTVPAEGTVHLRVPGEWRVEPAYAPWKLDVGEHVALPFTITPPSRVDQRAFTTSAVSASKNAETCSEGYRPVGYAGLTYTNYYTPATTRIVPVDVTTAPNLKIAYIPGTGDDVPSALDQLGVTPHILTPANLTVESLKSYDAVILGVRAYEHSDLAAANAALNAYAAAGGIVIAQYNTGRLPQGTGPYPLDLGGSEKVVEEDAPVKIVAPGNPLLAWPNKITAADFDHWVEERGHGFMATWDPHYTPLLETHDHGQQPQLGGLLVARTGRGAWIYLGLAVYRQLPEGVPGAYRLLANLISAAKNPNLQPTPSR
jgi:LmbE family N-acetylglucosaminyl deacetylase